LADIRRGLTHLDRQLLEWCAHKKLFVHLLLTKSDKLSRSAANQALKQVQRDMPINAVTVQLFSALRNVGLEQCGEKVLALLWGSD